MAKVTLENAKKQLRERIVGMKTSNMYTENDAYKYLIGYISALEDFNNFNNSDEILQLINYVAELIGKIGLNFPDKLKAAKKPTVRKTTVKRISRK